MNRICLTAGFLLAACAHAQPPATAPTTSSTQPAGELPESVRAALAQTQDNVQNFDQPGFLAVLEFVSRSERSPGFAQTPIAVNDWRDLAERPNDFRGRPITISGVVGRNKNPWRLNSRPDLGLISQLELSRPDQPLAITLILTPSAGDIPVNSTITVTGYFVMLRSYHTATNRLQTAALIVAPGPTSIEQTGPATSTSGEFDWTWVAIAVVGGLLLAGFVIRRAGRTSARPDLHSLTARREAPVDLSQELDQWAEQDRPERDDRPRRPS
jgi:hypothetical protein